MSKNLDDVERRIDRAQEKFSPHWEGLGEEERQLANKITCLTEYVGGRAIAAKVMGVGATTIDNYRTGSTQPKYLEILKLVKAVDFDIQYLLLGSEFWTLVEDRTAPKSIAPLQGPEIDEDVFAKIGQLLQHLHSEFSIRYSMENLMRDTARAYNDVKARARDPYDADELMTLLPWLEASIRKELSTAKANPGLGKRLA